MALHIYGARFEEQQESSRALELRGGRQLSSANGGGNGFGGGGVHRHTGPPPPPLRVSNPARFAAFLAEAEAYAAAAAEREDCAERARAARDGDRYRTRAEREAAAAAAAAEQQRRKQQQEQQQQQGTHGGGESGGGDAAPGVRRFDASVDYYEALGARPGASRRELRRAYRAAALRLHPDKRAGKSAEEAEADAAAFAAVAAAADVLLDADTRAAYDKARGSASAAASRAAARGGSAGGARSAASAAAAAAAAAAAVRQAQAPASAAAAEAASRRVGGSRPAPLRVEVPVSMALCCEGGAVDVVVSRRRCRRNKCGDAPSQPAAGTRHTEAAAPEEEEKSFRVAVRLGAADGEETLFEEEGHEDDGDDEGAAATAAGDLIFVLRHAPHALFTRAGAKDVRCAPPPGCAPRRGDIFWASSALPTPRREGAAAARAHASAALLPALLRGEPAVSVRLPREGLPDPSAPYFEPAGDVIVDVPLPQGPPPRLRCVLRAGALLLIGGDAPAADAAAVSAATAALHAPPGARHAVCVRLGGTFRGGAASSAASAGAAAGVAAVLPRCCWRALDLPEGASDSRLMLVEDDWAALASADVIILHGDAADDDAAQQQQQQQQMENTTVTPPPPPVPDVADDMTASFMVIFTSPVAIRCAPSVDAEAVGAAPPGAVLRADARWRDWVRLDASMGTNIGYSPELRMHGGERWVLSVHPSLGSLLQPCGGAGAARAAVSLPRLLPAAGPPLLLRVRHAPLVAVRAAPALDAPMLAARRTGERVEALGVSLDGWARVLLPPPPPPRGNQRVASAAAAPKFGWMLMRHPSLGPLMNVISDAEGEQDDDSDDDDEAVGGNHNAGDAHKHADAGSASVATSAGAVRAAREARLHRLCAAAAACGVAEALQRAAWRGALVIAVGAAGVAAVGAAPGRHARAALLPYVLRQSDDVGVDAMQDSDGDGGGGASWHDLEAATDAWAMDVQSRGVPRRAALLVPPAVAWAAEWPAAQPLLVACCSQAPGGGGRDGWGAARGRGEMRRAAAAAASAARAIAARAATLRDIAAATAADTRGTSDAEALDCDVDAFGVRRGACAASACAAYDRPRLLPGPNSALLLLCARCGEPASAHELLV
jgi:DnaJ-class molecular chaperone